jgi:hypothetical protein
MRTAVVTSVEQLDPDALSVLTLGGQLYDSVRWFRYAERMAPDRQRYVYVSSSAGDPLGLTVARVVPDSSGMALYDLASFVQGTPPLLYPNLVAAVSGAHCVLLTAGDTDAGVEQEVVAALARGVQQHAQDEGFLACGFLYVPERHLPALEAVYERPGFLAAGQTWLHGDWTCFDDYLFTLKRTRRNKVRRERHEYAGSGIVTRVLPGSEGLDEQTAALQLALRIRHGGGGSVADVLRDYAALTAELGDDLLVFRAELHGELVGMSLCLRDDDRLHVRLVGFDDDRPGLDFTYFNVTYYEPIEWGIRQGIRSWVFGTGTYQAKTSRGATVEPLYAVVDWPCDPSAGLDAAVLRAERALSEACGLPPRSPAGSPGAAGHPPTGAREERS